MTASLPPGPPPAPAQPPQPAPQPPKMPSTSKSQKKWAEVIFKNQTYHLTLKDSEGTPIDISTGNLTKISALFTTTMNFAIAAFEKKTGQEITSLEKIKVIRYLKETTKDGKNINRLKVFYGEEELELGEDLVLDNDDRTELLKNNNSTDKKEFDNLKNIHDVYQSMVNVIWAAQNSSTISTDITSSPPLIKPVKNDKIPDKYKSEDKSKGIEKDNGDSKTEKSDNNKQEKAKKLATLPQKVRDIIEKANICDSYENNEIPKLPAANETSETENESWENFLLYGITADKKKASNDFFTEKQALALIEDYSNPKTDGEKCEIKNKDAFIKRLAMLLKESSKESLTNDPSRGYLRYKELVVDRISQKLQSKAYGWGWWKYWGITKDLKDSKSPLSGYNKYHNCYKACCEILRSQPSKKSKK